MEKQLEQSLDELMNVSGVIGIVCSDDQGLCLSHRGQANVHSAGYVSTLTKLAAKLDPDVSARPTICLESDNINVLIQDCGGTSMALYKIPCKGSLA